jgi:uncharacterized circularly permuted ATP-grasp superfamily protein/uncharacterized alpha-E superfamily protein
VTDAHPLSFQFQSQSQSLLWPAAELLPESALPWAAAGHFDEARGCTGANRPDAPLTAAWAQFFAAARADGQGDFDQRAASLARQIRDNGVTYNVYADQGGPQRPWSLDLFPLIVSAQSWQQIVTGVTQRARLLNAIMADVYGVQQVLAKGLLPPALVQGHPGYLRNMRGVPPVGGAHLNIVAFDLARGPDGNWWVVSQRTQAPSGLGYLLENRLAVSRLFPQAFAQLQVQRLGGSYRALIERLKMLSPAGGQAHLALLTPGPFNETYFEHAYLARYLGITLVEGSDLTVRDQKLFLRTLRGLVPVHGLLKRLDDEFLDPLELRADSALGVPGLLQAIRAGNVMVVNAPGSAFLESPALLGFLPALSRQLLNEDLQLPALPTWWCGEDSARRQALARLGECAIKPTYPAPVASEHLDAVLGHALSGVEQQLWKERVERQPNHFTLQAYEPLSQMPSWHAQASSGGHMQARSVLLRVFAMSDDLHGWQVLPGGLARVAGGQADMTTMQRGGSSADVWVLTDGKVDPTSLLPNLLTPAALAERKRYVTSRAAENLFWLGRYTERAENAVRLARLTLECLNGEDQQQLPLLNWLQRLAVRNSLVGSGVPSPVQARRVFERSLIAGLADVEQVASVGYSLRAMGRSAAAVRERLSQEHWDMVQRCENQFFAGCNAHPAGGDYLTPGALTTLMRASVDLAAITGAQTDRMSRDDGWRLLSIGRLIERLVFLSTALAEGFDCGSVRKGGGFEAMLSLFDSTISYNAQYQQNRDVAPLLDLLVLDRDNPRSLAWVMHTLRGRLAKLEGAPTEQMGHLSRELPNPRQWLPDQLWQADAQGRWSALAELLQSCTQAALQTSEAISSAYFTHSRDSGRSLSV